MGGTGVTWLVGRADDLGVLDERLAALDATVEETWPGGSNETVVALVRSAPGDVDRARDALGADVEALDDEGAARQAAERLARATA